MTLVENLGERSTSRAVGPSKEPIAIVGIGCRLPGGTNGVQNLLSVLREGRDCITEIPPDRWDINAVYDPDAIAPGKTYVRSGGFVTDIDRFDAGFFGISTAEASRMDPQQRMVLETVWHALEDGGQSSEQLMHSNTGVFLAMMNTNDYSQLKGRFEGLAGITPYDAVGDTISITAGRISYFLGLEGPCMAVDTACSGSLVALHLAVNSLLSGECDSAIVAGVSAMLHPGVNIAFSKVGLMSRAGRCRAFDEAADGYVRGEGCVAVLLRRQHVAVQRRDRIRACIAGTAINQDGRTPAMTAPNGRAQEKVVRMALERAGVSPSEIGYVEAHGTGTAVGDPIEMSALVSVFGPDRPANETLYIGSVKTNFGHIEAGAGLLGVIKAALSLDTGEILPSLNFNRMNPNIDLHQAPIRVPTTSIPWPRGKRRRAAGVNSFGYSGTNAHAVLTEAPMLETESLAAGASATASGVAELVLLSASSAESLRVVAAQWETFLKGNDSTPLRDVAFTAATGRTHLAHRLAIVTRSREEMAKKLAAWQENQTPPGLSAGHTPARKKPRVAFVFSGQGSQHGGMSRGLYEREPSFADAIDRCAAAMAGQLDLPLTEILFGSSSADLLHDTRYAQPAIFALEYALAELLRAWGVEPCCLLGHSVGEIVAACVSGVLSLEDAAMLVVARGRLMSSLPRGGKMLALDAGVAEAAQFIAGQEGVVSIAALNGERAVVISGAASGIAVAAERAAAAGRRAKELDVSHAFHSPLMDPILDEIGALSEAFQNSAPKIPIISNVTAEPYGERLPRDYWRTHVRNAVRFHEGVKQLVELGCDLIVEVGPHPALIPAMSGTVDLSRTRCIPTLMRDRDDLSQLSSALGILHTAGVPLAFDRIYSSRSCRRVSLPLYPFKRDRHWLKINPAKAEASSISLSMPVQMPIVTSVDPLLGQLRNGTARNAFLDTGGVQVSAWSDQRVLGVPLALLKQRRPESKAVPSQAVHEDAQLQAKPQLEKPIEAVPAPAKPEVAASLHPLVGKPRSTGAQSASFETRLGAVHPWSDHRVLGVAIFPAAGYLELAARGFAAASGNDWEAVTLREVSFERPLLLVYGRAKAVSLTLEGMPQNGTGQATFVIAALNDAAEVYCRGKIGRAAPIDKVHPIEEHLPRCPLDVPIGAFYAESREAGLDYGAAFSSVRELRRGSPGSGEAIGRVKTADEHPFLHSVLLDGCLHVISAAARTLGSDLRGAFVPATLGSITFWRSMPAELWSHVTLRANASGRALLAELVIVTDDGEVVAEIDTLELRKKESVEASAGRTEKATAHASTTRGPSGGGALRFETREQLLAALKGEPKQKQVAVLSAMLADEIKGTMGQMADDVDLSNIAPGTALLEIGMDSLMITEFQRRLQEKLNFRFRPMEGLDYQTIESLAEYLLDQVLQLDVTQAAPGKEAGEKQASTKESSSKEGRVEQAPIAPAKEAREKQASAKEVSIREGRAEQAPIAEAK